MNRCTICQQKLAKKVLSILIPDRFEKSVGISDNDYKRDWFQCDGCGCLANIFPPASSGKIDSLREKYYEIDFAGSDIGEKYRSIMSLPPEESDNVGRVNRIFDFLRSWFPDSEFQKINVLDIGAGTGFFIKIGRG